MQGIFSSQMNETFHAWKSEIQSQELSGVFHCYLNLHGFSQ